jgi:hypothetical protein
VPGQTRVSEFFFSIGFSSFLIFILFYVFFLVIRRDILINKKWLVRENMNIQGRRSLKHFLKFYFIRYLNY